MMREGFVFAGMSNLNKQCNTCADSFCPSFPFRTAFGVLDIFVEDGVIAVCLSSACAPKHEPLSVRFIPFFFLSFLVSERSGPRKRPAEQKTPCVYRLARLPVIHS